MEPQSTEEKIMASALSEFAEYGYEGARVDRIAERAGVNKAMIYYHYKGKESLYEKIIRDTAEGIYAFISEKMKSDLNFMRIIMREISAGGKYIRKIFLPNTLLPFLDIFTGYINDLKKTKAIRDINPMYTFFQIAGGILYFNMLRILLNGTDFYPVVFGDNYLNDFKKNMSLIVREGLMKAKGEV
jgi:AcrR family transcriptional regulator